MIHVCSLARLHDTVADTGASHIVTLLRLIDRVERPGSIAPANHLILGMDDIAAPIDGYTHPAEEHVVELIEFVQRWDRRAPLVMHCYAGISRSTAGAFISACALNPGRDEAAHRPRHPRLVANRDAQPDAGQPRRPHPRPQRPHDRGGRGARPGPARHRRRTLPARSGMIHCCRPGPHVPGR